MTATPDPAEWFIHSLDVACGLACLGFLAVACWGVASELRLRWKARGPLVGRCPPAPGDGPDPRAGRIEP